MLLHHCTWQEVEEYLRRSKGIVLPIGSTEQHGPNGLLGTDVICPEIIARLAADEAGFLVGPTFTVGSAQHHLGFAGTMTLRPSTMIAAIVDWTTSLRRHGFTRLYWLNGHGGNIAPLEAAFAEIHAASSLHPDLHPSTGFRLKCRNWWELEGVDELSQELYPRGLGHHATPAEVAVTRFAFPDAQKNVPLSPSIAPDGEIHDAQQYRASFPDGRIASDPSQATAEHGERLARLAAKSLIADYQAFLGAS